MTQNFGSFDLSNLKYVGYLLASCLAPIPIFLYYYKKPPVTVSVKEDHLVINIYSADNISVFTNYVEYNQQYYDSMINTDIGDLDKMYECRLYPETATSSTKNINTISKMQDVPIKFDDEYLGIKGYYLWKKTAKQSTDKDKNVVKDVSFKYVELHIQKEHDKIINPEQLFTKMSTYVTDLNKNKIKLKYTKVINLSRTTHNHTVTFYDGEKQPLEVLETKYIKTLFHQERDRLWSIIKNCCMNFEFYRNCGQVGRVSLLLHGPPGTGKSTFAYRIAMVLQRHLISLDLRSLDRSEAYQILQSPELSFAGCKTYKDAVFLFEEFDISIKNLYHKRKNTSEG